MAYLASAPVEAPSILGMPMFSFGLKPPGIPMLAWCRLDGGTWLRLG